MSDYLLDLDPDGNAAQAQRIQQNLSDKPPEPTVFQGFGKAVGNHTMRAAANVARTGAILLAAPAVAIEKLTEGDNYSGDPNPLSGPIFRAVDDYFTPAVDYWTPKANETGKAGQIVGGLVEGIAPLTLGPAGVPAMLGNAQVGTSMELMGQGVDVDTSLKVGLAASASNAVGFKIPFVGKTLLGKMASGAAGNLVVNTGATVVQKKTLEGQGYTEAAQQFDPTNAEARTLDVLMGAAFGVVAHASAPRPTTGQGDAVLATRNAKNFQQDSAPGVPKDAASSAAHQANLEQAMLQLMRGEKVDLASSIQEADFLKPPSSMKETPTAVAVREAIADSRPADAPVLPLTGPRGVRNNNPGNIVKSATPWQGKVEGTDPKFETFATPELGIRALAKNLLTSQDRHGSQTLTDIISRWAPSVENNTGAYIAAVAKRTGLNATEPINLRDPSTLHKVTSAIIQQENGKHPYSDATIQSGVDLALSGRSATTPEQITRAIPKAESLPPEQRQIETNLATKIANDFEGAKTEYAKLPESDNGRIINTDIARELSPEYDANRTLSAAVHEPASWFTKEYYADRLAQLPKGSDVLFTAGGTGAGKSTALQGIPEMQAANQRAALVYDTNMNGLKSSIQKIEQALDAGHNVKVVMVDRDPVEALVKGALPRAEKIGRTVPLNEHYKTHRDVPMVMRELQKRYADNPRFSMSVVDNTRGKGGAVLTSLDKLPQRDYNQIERQLHDALEHEYQSGHIKEPIYRGTLPTGRLGSDHPQGISAGLPEGNRSANRYPDGGGEGNRPDSMESANGRGNAQADTGAAGELLRRTQGGEGGDAQGSGLRHDDSPVALPGIDQLHRLLSESGVQLPPEVSKALSHLSGKSTPVSKAGDLARKLRDSVDKSVDPASRSSMYAIEANRLLDTASTMGNMPEIAQRYRDASEILTGWSKASSLPATPEVNALRQLVQEDTTRMVLDSFDADGKPQYRSAGDAMAQIEAEHAELAKESKSYDAAVNCLLRRGA